MNSTSLQKQFQEVYKGFYAENDIVTSGCFSMPWWPRAVWEIFNKLILKSCIPLRCYVWLKKRSDNKIVYKDFIMYSSANHSFDLIPAEKIISDIENTKPLIESFLKESWKSWFGFDVSVLSELGKWHSLGFSGTLPIVLAKSLFQALGERPDSNMVNSSFLDSQIYNFSLRIELVIRRGKTYWNTIAHTMNGDFSPALYLVKLDKSELNNEDTKELINDFITFDRITPEASWRFDFPFDFALVYSGIPSEAFKLEHANEADIRNTNGLSEFLNERIFEKTRIERLYMDKLLQSKSPYSIISDAMGVLNLATIEKFHKMFESGYSEALVSDFLSHMNHLREILSIVEPQSEFADSFIKEFQNIKTNSDEEIGIFPMYSGKLGWGYVIGLKPWISRKTFSAVCDAVKIKYPDMAVDFFYPLDKSETSGITIEQSIKDEMYSKFLPKGQVRYISNHGETLIWDYQALLESKKDQIIFDAIARKIYIFGKKPTSDEIPSQTTVVDLMNILIDWIGKDFQNSQLPVSSYSKSKNEMIGKIIAPLVKLTEKHFKEALPLSCRWDMSSFYLRLEDTRIPLCIIRKL